MRLTSERVIFNEYAIGANWQNRAFSQWIENLQETLAFLATNSSVSVAFTGYSRHMKVNPVMYNTLIIRSQIEYSTTQSVILRCVLETPATGQRRGFTDLDALLFALRTELTELQIQITPPEKLEKPCRE